MTTETQKKIPCPLPDEPGAVYMTPLEWETFVHKVGAGCAWYWCERAEDYAADAPKKWRKYSSHYRTLLKWHAMKVGDGYEFFNHPQHGPGFYRSWVIEKLKQGGAR